MCQDYIRDIIVTLFKGDSYIIREKITVMKIRLSKLLGGLYYLKLSHVKLNASIHVIETDLSRLWNSTIGHLSHNRTVVNWMP